MNWLLISLPLIGSAVLLLSTAGLYLSSQFLFRDIKVPSVAVREPNTTPIRDSFSKVFSRDVGPPVAHKDGKTEEVGVAKNVTLVGTAVGVKSLALLKVDGNTFVISEGETKKGIKLKKVFRDRVVILTQGRERVLKLKRRPIRLSRAGKSGYSGSTGGVTISRREVERLTKDPGVMFRELRLVPYVKNGKTEGFIFEWIKPGSLFYKAGLRKGDILVSINNMTIKSGEDAFRILQVLRNEPSLRVIVLRNGQRQEINVRIE